MRLIAHLLQHTDDEVVACVRREAAAQAIQQMAASDRDAGGAARLRVLVCDYTNTEQMADATREATVVVHLVGILKEDQRSSYVTAHEQSCQVLVKALEGAAVQRVIYLSILGSHPESSNACLRSKGSAEEILLSGSVPCCVLQVPMVLGEGDYASFALRSRAASKLSFTFRAASLEQPIYAGDVVDAIVAAAAAGEGRVMLAGPQQMTRRALTQQAAGVLGTKPTLVSLPIGLGMAVAALLERLPNPPITRAMLGVLDHDDHVDPQAALSALGLEGLTPLADTLQRVLQT